MVATIIWKENILEDLEGGLLEYKTVGEFLVGIKKEFGGGDKKSVKVVELKRLEQEGKIMKEFKKGMSGAIRKKLIKAKRSPTSIEQ